MLLINSSGQIEVLATRINGRPFGFFNGLDLADDGTLWFSDASTRSGYDDVLDSLIEASDTARSTSYRADTRFFAAPMDGFFCRGRGIRA
ncbi:MAG TPA: hypothetical protein DD440_04480 [Porticoccaceae bacterium]|nr:hypothetical protein [Porticoccaceae bacterium]